MVRRPLIRTLAMAGGLSLGTGGGSGPVSAPVNSTPPSISGTPTQGQTLTASQGFWTNSPTGYAYQWKADGVNIVGATAPMFMLTASEVGKLITVTVTASNSGGSASSTSASAGPVASSGSEYAHLSVAAQTAAWLIRAEFTTNGWNDDPDTVTWDDTIVVTSGAELHRWIRNTYAIGGVSRNPARNQRLQLTSTGDWTFAGAVAVGGGTTGLIEMRGLDYLANGKMLLIEPQTVSPEITMRFQATGCRGVHIRNLRPCADIADWGLNTTWAPYTVASISAITNGGTGYTLGDTLTATGGTREAPATLTVTGVSGGVVTAVNVAYGGKLVTVAPTGWSGGTGTGFAATATLQGTSGNPRDTPQFQILRSSSFFAFPVMTFKGMQMGPGHKAVPTTDPALFPTMFSAQSVEQLYIEDCSFKHYQTGVTGSSIRRYKFHRTDGRKGIGDYNIVLHAAATTAYGAGPSFNTQWPDKISYQWSRLNTATDAVDDCTKVNSQGEDLRFDQEHTDFHQCGTSGDAGNYKVLFEFNCGYFERVTYQDRNNSSPAGSTGPSVRVAGGTQFHYNDDLNSSLVIDMVSHSNLGAASTSGIITAFNGTCYVERNTCVRVGAIVPNASVGAGDGFNYSAYDGPALIYTRQIKGATNANHTILDNICTAVQPVTSSTFDPPTVLNSSGNLIADPRPGATAGSTYSDIFVGTFTADGQGRTSYTGVNESGTPAQLRASMWAIFEPKAAYVNKGALNPALWPAA